MHRRRRKRARAQKGVVWFFAEPFSVTTINMVRRTDKGLLRNGFSGKQFPMAFFGVCFYWLRSNREEPIQSVYSVIDGQRQMSWLLYGIRVLS